jgi:hypothetical protein
VQNLAVSWEHSAQLALVLAGGAVALQLAASQRLRACAPIAVEAALIAGLYALWQRAGELSVLGTSGAFDRARWIQHVEHNLRLPSEHDLQRLVLGHPLLVQAANLYYAAMHFTGLFVFLLWVFLRHREAYARVRTTLVLTTFACLLIQLLPVAPPRLLDGYVDTADRYGQSVYGFGLAPDQLSAMPSVHVAWAVLAGWYAWRLAASRWRWLAVAHAVLTVFVVVCTANHWWLDGIAGVAVLVACAWLTRALFAAWAALRSTLPSDPAARPGPRRREPVR